MPNIIKNRVIVDDQWISLDDETAIPEQHTGIIISHSRWQQEREQLIGKRVGIKVDGDSDFDDIVSNLDHFEIIALDFPAFNDGRCYSVARLLRDRHGYEGELRAVGNVLRDQIAYMERCGINAFVIDEGRDINSALKAFTEYSVKYQIN